jgi:hypothetical protein
MRWHRWRAGILALASAAALATPAIAQNLETPVRIGFDGPDYDACGSIGQVTGLNPRGDNYLSVRARPDAGASELDRLGPGREIWLCDAAQDARWLGVLYMPGADGAGDCGVGSPVAAVRIYRGGCSAGWISADYVIVIAG